MKLFDEDTFDAELINSGAEEVKKEDGYFTDLENSISKGLISTLKTLISNSEILNKLTDETPGNRKNKTVSLPKKKGIIGTILEIIVSFSNSKENTQKKDKTKLQKKIGTLLNNQNIEISKLRKENEEIGAQVFENSEKVEELMNFVVNYMDDNEAKIEKESSKDLNVSVTDEKKFRNM